MSFRAVFSNFDYHFPNHIQASWRYRNKGDIIAGKYEVISLLGAGGLGEVFLCQDIETKIHVAVKRLKDDITVPPSVIDQTQREAKILSGLRHRNLIRIMDFGLDKKGFYFILEFVNGPSLADIIGLGPLPMEVFLAVATNPSKGWERLTGKGCFTSTSNPPT